MKRLLPFLAIAALSACAPLQKMQNNAQQSSVNTSQTSSANEPAVEGDAEVISSKPAIAPIDERLLPSGALEIGKTDAPVSLLLFTNTSCAYCREFQNDIFPRLMDEYVRKGTLRVSVMPYILQKYPESMQAAGTLMCAAQQHKGWAVLDLLFKQDVRSATFRTSLQTMEIDANALQTCAQSEGMVATINAQQSMAKSLNIDLVPTYFVNGHLYTGLPEYADMRGQVEQALSAE